MSLEQNYGTHDPTIELPDIMSDEEIQDELILDKILEEAAELEHIIETDRMLRGEHYELL